LEAILARSPTLRQQVAVWERRLTPLAVLLPEATPRPELWRAIETVLDAAGSPATFTARAQEDDRQNSGAGRENQSSVGGSEG
jgi:anti-sigma-K factor RskA